MTATFTGCNNWFAQYLNKNKNSTSEHKQNNPNLATAEEDKLITKITTQSQFEEFIKQTTKVCVVKLDAEWCSACKYIHPFLLDAAKKSASLAFAKVDIDALSSIAKDYKIIGVPTLLFFKEGKEIPESRLVGPDVKDGDDLLAQITVAIANAHANMEKQ